MQRGKIVAFAREIASLSADAGWSDKEGARKGKG